MATVSRTEIFAQAAKRLRADFEALAIVPHNASKGQEAEDILRRFLNGHLPKRFAAGSGFITDPTGEVSNQTDVVIYDAHNCPVYRASDMASIFPSNNVAAVIEVKSRLNKAALEDAASKVARIKALKKTKPFEAPSLVTAQTMGVLFAFATDVSLEKIAEHYKQTFTDHGMGRHIDSIFVLDQGMVTLAAKSPQMPSWNIANMTEGFGGKAAEGMHIAVSVGRFGDATLDVMFRVMLPHLAHFRQLVDHPGFDLSALQPKNETMLMYLTSISVEKNPTRRAEKLRRYATEVAQEFARNPIPPTHEDQ